MKMEKNVGDWEKTAESGEEVAENREETAKNREKTAESWGFNFKISVKRKNATGDCFIQSVGGNFE